MGERGGGGGREKERERERGGWWRETILINTRNGLVLDKYDNVTFSLLPFEGHPRGNLPSGMSGQPLHYMNLCVCVYL